MVEILFEDPFWLAFIAAPVLFVLWGVWYRTCTRTAAHLLLAGLVLVPLLFAMQWFVVTDREAITQVTRQFSDAVKQKDIDGVIDLFDPSAKFEGGFDRERFRKHLVYLLNKYAIQNPSVFGFVVEVDGSKGTIRCAASCDIKSNVWSGSVPSNWQLEFNRIDDHWLITHLKPLRIAGRNYSSFFEID